MGKDLRISFAALALALIFLMQAVPLVSFINSDSSPTAWDDSWHAMISLNIFRQITGRSAETTAALEKQYPIFGFANNYYPPLYHILTFPFYLVFGEGLHSALLVNLFFLAVIILSAFFIGKKISGNLSGLLCAFFSSTIPLYSALMREYWIDFSLCAMVFLSLAFLVYSENFRSRKFSVLFGLSLAAGMLTKWTFIIYIFAPAALSIYHSLKCKEKDSALSNFIAAAAICALLSFFWYNYYHLKNLIPELSAFSGVGSAEGHPKVFSFAGITYYLRSALMNFSALYFALFSAGAFWMTRKREISHYAKAALLSLAFIYLALSVIANKDAKYIAPAFAYLSCCAGIGLSLLLSNKKKHFAVFALIIIIALSLAQYSEVAFFQKRSACAGNLCMFSIQMRVPEKNPAVSEKGIINALDAITNDSAGGFSLCVVSEGRFLNDVNIPYYSMKGNYPAALIIGAGCNPLEFDYSIEGVIEDTWRAQMFLASSRIIQENQDSFLVIYNSGKVRVYRLASK
jgi:4-amino-4-deoxy-L-arabinose transferase-like glycosyltransferase